MSTKKLPPELEREVASLTARCREIRHDLHRHPELGFEEHRTQGVVRSWLEELGYAPRASAETGLIADLVTAPGAPMIALRADLDCLPIEEKIDLPYKSEHAGRSHKCGHDGHTAILMGVASVLAKHRASIPGNVRLLFQPAEEGVRGGGAKVMLKDGALDGVREVYGLHNWPVWPRGEVRVKAGAMLATVTNFELHVKGIGGHGSQPQVCRDPIVAASHLVVALQTIISRGLGYQGGAVVTVGLFQAGTVENVIPPVARLKGTIRTFDESVRARVLERFREVCGGITTMFGTPVEVQIADLYPTVQNDPMCSEAVARVAGTLVGETNVKGEDLPIAGGEDFAYFTNTVPGAFFFLGANRGPETAGCHHPDFDFDDEIIPLGMKMFLGLVLDRLSAR